MQALPPRVPRGRSTSASSPVTRFGDAGGWEVRRNERCRNNQPDKRHRSRGAKRGGGAIRGVGTGREAAARLRGGGATRDGGGDGWEAVA